MYEVGTQLPERTFRVTRADLVRYAGASGDFNPIHWSDRVAAEVGLPSVIAHGMLTMALAARAVTDWVGDPGAMVAYTAKFTRPVPVPDDEDGAELGVSAVVKKVDGDQAQIDITVVFEGERVLGAARATVRTS